ncbi:short chain dehydrogenase/oxidoreductase [Aspergillus sclerotioniger CBS 115572]|uniref:Short chain dehydrogenase/oxidoreductase n=1 Tax=Aspergillus sclerotioniger CBS 115572 TaxID=1450535 RepID=A0A317WYC6_9EURO|nr:short chain dehydrogenase/oxidoreductase [Aspergillus sclerotioniger CBS 115572]PWY91359.1 short chain dehydrogenase/oxidoreductase [Aspergillus sclerotioniger CBS 115572]
MSINLTGKTCLVTGGAGGLGKAIAARFFSAGANVVICDVNEERLRQTSLDLAGPDGDARLKIIKTDITSATQVQTLFDEIVTQYQKLDILINNAGIMDHFDPVGDLDEGLWNKVIAVNLTAPFLLSKLAVRNMLAQEVVQGCIVNIVSLAGKAGFMAGAAYTASKHGLVGLTKNTASFYGSKGIRCNALMMGGMMTNITDAFMSNINMEGKDKAVGLMTAAGVPLCDVDRVAELCLSISCGPGAELINGTCIPVDHGLSGLLG